MPEVLICQGGKMQRYFNTEGRCKPDIHYMVRLDDRLARIRKLYVDRGKYLPLCLHLLNIWKTCCLKINNCWQIWTKKRFEI